MSNYDRLLQASKQYFHFVDQISSGRGVSSLEDSKKLFTEDCRKVFNGKVFFSTREAFVNDLLSLYNTMGAWKMHLVETIVAPEQNTVVIRLMVDLGEKGQFTAIVILRYDSKGLVREINEVFSEVKGGYNF